MNFPRLAGLPPRNYYRGVQQQAKHRQPEQEERHRLLAVGAMSVAALVFGGGRYLLLHSSTAAAASGLQFAGGARTIFGPTGTTAKTKSDDSFVQTFAAKEQRSFLEQHGRGCQQSFASDSKANLFVERFDALPPAYAVELWKYCYLYTAPGIYWDTSLATPLQLPSDIILGGDTANFAIAMDGAAEADFLLHQPPLHHSFLGIREPRSKVALGMMRYLLEAESLSPASLQETLALFVANDVHKKRAVWKFFYAACQDVAPKAEKENSTSPPIVLQVQGKGNDAATFASGEPCSAKNGEPCCQVWAADKKEALPVMSLLHSKLVAPPEGAPPVLDKNPLPFSFADRDDASQIKDSDLGMPVAFLPYIASVREFKTNAPPATIHETPNYFDILLRNNCLPHDKECFKCLKLGYKEGDEGGDCRVCEDKCPCYCKALCQVRPPPKRLAAEWEVTPPRYRVDPSRLIPRIIHQTWFEPVTKETYPNMSRLIESFRQSGWEYEFYDDDKAAQFLSAHFPPQVREAYDAIIPGAFKADLFRYCVLLIRGGVYADMDIMLESNLDQAVDGSIGFLTAQDSPGETIGHRSCLWNGLMASAPGHVFLAQTIQNVVNNARNRFTSVDYDDMLCPNPVLSVSHTVDTLFTCGPCILGASLNDVLKRHRQTGFDFGEIDLYETEKKKHAADGTSSKRVAVAIEPDDPRLLVPGRSVLLRQNKGDMGSHRFTNAAANLIVAATDMPEYDDRPKSIEHYSKSHVKFGVYGLTKLYTNNQRANEEIVIRVKPSAAAASTTTAS